MIAFLLLLQAAPALPIGAIGPQSLPAKGCAAYLWSIADRQFVAMATADPGQLRLSIDGRTQDLGRTSQTGQGPTGLGGTAEYRGGDVVATLDMVVEAKESLSQGAQVRDGVLRIDRAGRDGIVVPVAGLVGCRA